MLSPFGFAPQNDGAGSPTQNRSGVDFLFKDQGGEI